jgi:hypothetical protein
MYHVPFNLYHMLKPHHAFWDSLCLNISVGRFTISGPILPTPDLLGSGYQHPCELQLFSERNCQFIGMR